MHGSRIKGKYLFKSGEERMCPKIHSTIQITPLYTKYIGFNGSTGDPVEVRPFILGSFVISSLPHSIVH